MDCNFSKKILNLYIFSSKNSEVLRTILKGKLSPKKHFLQNQFFSIKYSCVLKVPKLLKCSIRGTNNKLLNIFSLNFLKLKLFDVKFLFSEKISYVEKRERLLWTRVLSFGCQMHLEK